MVDGLIALSKAVMDKGSAADERAVAMHLVAHGNGRQLREAARHLMDKGASHDVLEAAMARISAARGTQDDYLADGLAWLCKAILKSGNSQYKMGLTEVLQTAAHKSLRKYAELAAEGL